MSLRLTVNRAELLEGLKQLSKLVKKKGVGQGTLKYEQGSLVIDVGGISIEAAAEGEFPGLVRMSGASLLKLAGVLPDNDQVVFQAEGDRLSIDTFSLPIQIEDVQGSAGADSEHIPYVMEAPLYFLLGLEYKYSDVAVLRAGYWEKVNQARGEKARLIQAVAHRLAPLGVTKTDVAEMVEKALRRINGI
jgi:hypothetical protein